MLLEYHVAKYEEISIQEGGKDTAKMIDFY